MTALQIDKLNAWYGRSHVLQDVSLTAMKGEVVALVGRNGAGKTSLLKSVMGMLAKTSGSVRLFDHEVMSLPTHQRFHAGLAYVPEERRIVPGLTVRENIRLGILASARKSQEREVIDEIEGLFPGLGERLDQIAVTMSGGEQQMLAIARAIAADPALIMLDEPSEGIMPVLVDEMFDLFSLLKKRGKTIVLVEQNVELALEIADSAYVLDQGTIVHACSAAQLLADPVTRDRYCAI
jgi:branched-chain amino acid transport system ATP-binding protein